MLTVTVMIVENGNAEQILLCKWTSALLWREAVGSSNSNKDELWIIDLAMVSNCWCPELKEMPPSPSFVSEIESFIIETHWNMFQIINRG